MDDTPQSPRHLNDLETLPAPGRRAAEGAADEGGMGPPHGVARYQELSEALPVGRGVLLASGNAAAGHTHQGRPQAIRWAVRAV